MFNFMPPPKFNFNLILSEMNSTLNFSRFRFVMDLIRNLAWECIEWTEKNKTTWRSLSIKENNTFGMGSKYISIYFFAYNCKLLSSAKLNPKRNIWNASVFVFRFKRKYHCKQCYGSDNFRFIWRNIQRK